MGEQRMLLPNLHLCAEELYSKMLKTIFKHSLSISGKLFGVPLLNPAMLSTYPNSPD